ncbi:hypothetical protein POTG_00728 [Paenibacillus sp. oral taxon 786 str. D14]|uniref:hypothetical protein n=1 Tax=Paenibacillus sp. oral taxon 786 TaxID=652715 RepID=UPI0001AFD3E9|nr:hypothetical protein [Paenibacillus sp. oral taxon 786]EES74448.1 hypothetical protein POTG_00728 [Paenibacillus sp. oral taxon 786 str. D14]
MFKKGAVFLLSIVLLFTSLGAANASDDQFSKKSDVSNNASLQTVSVRDIVPSKYFESVKGKFHSKEAVLEATGFKRVTSKKLSDMKFENGAIIVNSFDEYAALLQYYADLEKMYNNLNILNSVSPTATYTDYSEQTIWGDGLGGGGTNLSWIVGIVQFERHDKSGDYKIVKVTDTDSVLRGFHPGNSWEHSDARTTYGINSGGLSGWAWIRGDRTLSIIWEGVGDVITKAEAYYMTF